MQHAFSRALILKLTIVPSLNNNSIYKSSVKPALEHPLYFMKENHIGFENISLNLPKRFLSKFGRYKRFANQNSLPPNYLCKTQTTAPSAGNKKRRFPL